MSDVTLTSDEDDVFAAGDSQPDEPAPGAEAVDSPPPAAPAPEGGFTIRTKKFVLQSLFEKASNVLPSKDIMPVLKNFQVEAKDGRIRVLATDLELSVISTSEMVSVSSEGTVVFPGKKMLDIIREAEEGEAEITVDGGTAQISVGRTNWDLRLMDGSEYPELPEIEDITLHPVDRVKFLGAISAVRYAAATDTVRPSLMMIDVYQGRMRAADGVRFQQVELQDAVPPFDFQIPIGAVDDLVKLLRTTDLDEVHIGESDFHLVFKIGSDTFIANKLVAQFPDVESLLLKPALQNDAELNVDRMELIDAVKRVRITADPETSALLLKLTRGTLTVVAKDKFGNHSVENLDARWDKGDRNVVVNHQFLSDMLHMADARSCQFYLGQDTKSRKSPLMLKDPETGMVGIISQMRADWVVD